MTRRFTVVTLALTAFVAFLVGAIVAGGFLRPSVTAETPTPPVRPTVISAPRTPVASLVNFADVVERLNPAVVNVDATSSGPSSSDGSRRRRPLIPDSPELFDGPRRDTPRRGAGSGFIIDA